MGDRIAYAGCWLAFRLVLLLPLPIGFHLLPWAGMWAYAEDFDQFCEWRAWCKSGRAARPTPEPGE